MRSLRHRQPCRREVLRILRLGTRDALSLVRPPEPVGRQVLPRVRVAAGRCRGRARPRLPAVVHARGPGRQGPRRVGRHRGRAQADHGALRRRRGLHGVVRADRSRGTAGTDAPRLRCDARGDPSVRGNGGAAPRRRAPRAVRGADRARGPRHPGAPGGSRAARGARSAPARACRAGHRPACARGRAQRPGGVRPDRDRPRVHVPGGRRHGQHGVAGAGARRARHRRRQRGDPSPGRRVLRVRRPRRPRRQEQGGAGAGLSGGSSRRAAIARRRVGGARPRTVRREGTRTTGIARSVRIRARRRGTGRVRRRRGRARQVAPHPRIPRAARR